MEEQEQKGLKFPLTWDKCPCCGSTEAVADMVAKEEKAKGRIGKNMKACIIQVISPITDSRLALLNVPILISHWDTCYKCGAVYSRNTDKTEGTIQQGSPPGSAPFQRPPMNPPSLS